MRPGTAALALLVVAAAVSCTPSRDAGQGQAAGPGAGGTLRVALVEPDSIDPSRASGRPGILVLRQICEPLVAADPLTGALGPGAAASWTIAPGARKVTFTLRSGLKFHNGREVTAQDYVFSLSRFTHPQSGSPLHFFLERVSGYVELRAGRAETLAGVKAADASTLEVELTEPFAELPAALSHPAAGSAIPREEVERGADAFAAAPVCTGPYALAEPWAKGQDIRLVRSSAHDRRGQGFADEIVFTIVPDLEAGYLLLEGEAAHVAEVPVGRLTQARLVRGRVESGPTGLVNYVGFPATKAPFDNPAFRRALSLAMDRRAIVDELLAGSRQVPAGFLPASAGPASAGSACMQGVRPSADVKLATEALQASGIDPAATRLTIYFNDSGSGHEGWLERVAQQWKAGLGIESVLKPDEWRAYLDLLAEGNADGPFRLGWPVDYPSPEALFGPLFASGSLDNYTRFASPEFDDLLTRARATVDGAERLHLYRQAEETLCRELPAAPTWFTASHVAFAASLASASRERVDVFGHPLLRELGFRS